MMQAGTRTKRKPRSHTAGADQAGFAARRRLILEHCPSAGRRAKATGVSPSAFRKWLKGVAEPSRDRLVALAEAAGVNVSWLAQGKGTEPDLQGLAAHAHATLSPDLAGHPNIAQFLVLPKR